MIRITLALFLLMVFACEKEPLLDDSYDDIIKPEITVDIKKIDVGDDYGVLYAVISDLNGNIIDVDDSNISISIEKNGVIEEISGYTVHKNGSPCHNIKIRTVLVMDYSGSVDDDSSDILPMETCVKSLINIKSNTDEIAVIKFDDVVVFTQEFTVNNTDLIKAVDSNLIFGKTSALYEACHTGINYAVSNSDGLDVPVVMAFTDGNNNRYPYDINALINTSLKYQIPVYTIGCGHSELEPPDTTKLQYIAGHTDGEYHWSPDYNTICGLYSRIPDKKNFIVVEFPLSRENDVQKIILTINYLESKYIATRNIFF